MYLAPRTGTKTYRRELRQRIRNALGTSSDPAPRFMAIYNAATALDDLMRRTTDGYFRITVTKRDGTKAEAEEIGAAADAWTEG